MSANKPAGMRATRVLMPLLFAGGLLAGCANADDYFDRRDTISFHAGDAVRSNIIVQTVDPWPRAAANRNIPANGERMQAAGERYHKGEVTPLQGLGTSSIDMRASPGSGQ